jgi:glutathione S-transferase
MLKLYGFFKVNAVARGHTRDLGVPWALEEMQLPFQLAGMDQPAHDLNTEAYRRLSPFAQIPAIDDDGLVLSESAAIVVYLAKKCGRLIPAGGAGETQVLRWCNARDEHGGAAAAWPAVAQLDVAVRRQLRQAPRVHGRLGDPGAREPGALVG